MVFRFLLRAGGATVKAGARAARGEGSFGENISGMWTGMGTWEVRAQTTDLGEFQGQPVTGQTIEGKGLIPVTSKTEIGFVTSVFDITGGDSAPVMSTLETSQEPDTRVFQNLVSAGTAGLGQGFTNWVQIGLVIPEFLIPPSSGIRQLEIVTRIIDMNRPPTITLGAISQSQSRVTPSVLGEFSIIIQHNFLNSQGYIEAADERDRATKLMVQLGVVVGTSDGELEGSEGQVIHDWIVKTISSYSGDRRETLKNELNDALRTAHSSFESGSLAVSAITDEMNEFADRSEKIEAVEICMDVIAANGIGSREEINAVRDIANRLGLDYDEVVSTVDRKLVEIDEISDQVDPEILLGIDPSWPDAQKKLHLNQEYLKWSNRTSTLSDPNEKKNAENMLGLIAELRKKYEG